MDTNSSRVTLDPYYMSQEKVGEGVRALANLLSSIDSEVYDHNLFTSALVHSIS